MFYWIESFEHYMSTSDISNNTGQNVLNAMIENVSTDDQNIQLNIELKTKLTN